MPTDMYQVKPFYDPNARVNLPSNMYTVKSLYESSNGTTAKFQVLAQPRVSADGSTLDHVEELEMRQEKILAKLADLRRTLDELTEKYGARPAVVDAGVTKTLSSEVKQVPSAKVGSPFGSGIHDIVINADPSSPPLSLFVAFEMLKQTYKVLATSYVHSSVKDLDRRLCDIVRNGSQVTRGDHQIALSLVWKQVDDGPELVVSPSKQFIIQGEVNIIRYINRIMNPSFDSEDILLATTFDDWLDIAEKQLLNGNSKQRTAAVKSLNNRLKKNEFLIGLEMSLADVVMWSALHQSQEADGAPDNVQKWMLRCNSNTVFRSVLAVLA